MNKVEAENVFLEEFFQAIKCEPVKQKKLEKALRVLEMERIKEIYESLSEEFVRKGIASNRFSELEELMRIACNNYRDCEMYKRRIDALEKIKDKAIEFMQEAWETPDEECDYEMVDKYHKVIEIHEYYEIGKDKMT